MRWRRVELHVEVEEEGAWEAGLREGIEPDGGRESAGVGVGVEFLLEGV